MTWQEYQAALPALPDEPTLEQWQGAMTAARELLEQVDESDRKMAGVILGDTLVQVGAFLGYVQ